MPAPSKRAQADKPCVDSRDDFSGWDDTLVRMSMPVIDGFLGSAPCRACRDK